MKAEISWFAALIVPWFNAFCVIAPVVFGLGIYQLRRMQTKVKMSAVMEERTRISREIHDTLAQGLIGIVMHLEAKFSQLLVSGGREFPE